MATNHYFAFHTQYWFASTGAISHLAKSALIDIWCMMLARDMKLEDDDNKLSISLRMTMDEWLKVKTELMSGKSPLVYEQDGYLVSDNIISAIEASAEATEKARKAQAIGVANRKSRKADDEFTP